MHENLEIPPPMVVLQTKKLWVLCFIPPLVSLTVIMIGIICYLPESGFILMLIPWVVLSVIFVCLACFNAVVAKRYQGISKVFLGWAFFLGQIIICLALWFGSLVFIYKTL